MSRPTARWLAAAALSLSGCAAGSAGRPYALPSPPGSAETLRALARVRGLPVDAPIEVQTLDDEAFLRARDAASPGASAPAPAEAYAFWSAFTMADRSADIGAMGRRIRDDNLAGFYDPHTKRLYVRHSKGNDSDWLTLAHEAEHALQDRFFSVPDPTKAGSTDEALALRALYEGDATLAALVVSDVHAGGTGAETLARVARLDEQRDATGGSSLVRASADVPPLLRTQVGWPYFRGAAFVAQLAVSGGWPLVDAALRNPPRTTEQVLHAEKYIAGEGAIEVRSPSAPEGFSPTEIGRMGELQTRFFLAQCLDDRVASAGARGWGGDAYLIASRGEERALLWSTVWDDAESAARFARALEARRACGRSGPKPAFTVVRDGTRVAFVQGLDSDGARAVQAAALLPLVSPPPPPVPSLGRVTLRLHPPISVDFAGRGSVDDRGHFVDPAYAIDADVGGLRLLPNRDVDLLAVGDHLAVAITPLWAPPSGALSDTFLAAFARSRLRPSDPVIDLGTSRVALASTSLEARTLQAGPLAIRLALVPACGGRISIAVVTAAAAAMPAEEAAERWLRTVRVGEGSPACDAQKTLRDPSEPDR